MVIEQREQNGKDEPNAQPKALFLQEIELVAVAVGCECASAIEHHQSNRDQDSDRQHQYVCALFMHLPGSSLDGPQVIQGIINL